ncbi:hypothetical protein GM3709_3931 (plasmid) [Geminocystis sp. NIES-3709]|nr:hypothetical protein GM3709_3931 [Geminocystis sp. NIES-3709]
MFPPTSIAIALAGDFKAIFSVKFGKVQRLYTQGRKGSLCQRFDDC